MKIDFVVLWVDSNDPEWIASYNHYRPEKPLQNNARFRNWGLFRYWFRSVERYAPWVNKVYLVTNGKFPDWINPDCEKLVLVKHSDFIPQKYLPTFNSKTIELNLGRIDSLSEHFVYFNDDIFINAPVTPDKYSCAYGLWSFLPDEEISSLQLKAYEFMRDVYLFFQHFRRPELNVRGMVFAFKTDLARKYGFRNDIIRGEDGSLALNLKQDGKIRFVRSRKVRSVTSNSILKVQGTSLWDEVVHRGKKGAMGLTGLLVSKRQYEDKVDNLIKN